MGTFGVGAWEAGWKNGENYNNRTPPLLYYPFLYDWFKSFKVCSDAKERVGCRKQREATAPIQSLVKLQPWFWNLRWKTCLWQNCSLGFCACSEGPALGQNTLMMIMIQKITDSNPSLPPVLYRVCTGEGNEISHNVIYLAVLTNSAQPWIIDLEIGWVHEQVGREDGGCS